MKAKLTFICLSLILLSLSCKKPEGEGGTSSIHGKVHVTHYDPYTNTYPSDYPAAFHDVYIIYGDQEMYGDDIETTPEGNFEFKNLRPGNYRIYTYSKNVDQPFHPSHPDKMIIIDVTISKNKQSVDAGTLEIHNYDDNI